MVPAAPRPTPPTVRGGSVHYHPRKPGSTPDGGEPELHGNYGPEAAYAVAAEAALPTTMYEQEIARGLELGLQGAAPSSTGASRPSPAAGCRTSPASTPFSRRPTSRTCAFVLGHYWSRITPLAAAAAIAVGVAVRLVLFVLTPTMYGVENTVLHLPNDIFGPGFDSWPTFIAPVASLLAFVAVALARPAPISPAPTAPVTAAGPI